MSFDPFDFGAFEHRREQSTSLAKTAAKGLSPEQLVPGALVTLSTCKATGDCSYVSDIWEVVATSVGTAIIKPTGLCEKPWSDKPRAIQIHEREFYAAEALADAIRASAVEA